MTEDSQLLILSENRDKILERIQKIEQNLPQAGFEGGLPTPNWDNKVPLQDMMNVLNVPGTSIAVINNFEIEWVKCYGIRDARTEQKITLETLFEAGSSSKMFTAAAALKVKYDKLIDLHESVNIKLKTWKIPDNEFTKEKEITLKHLLTHTSGINRPDSMFGSEKGKEPTITQILKGESPALNDPVEVEFIPGTNHQYSNIAYIVIEKLLQDITGRNLTQIIQETIFDPLEMTNSAFDFPSKEIRSRMIVHHNEEGKAQESGFMKGALAHGGLISTPLDIAKFVVAIMESYQGKSSKVIPKKITEELISEQLALEPTKFFGMTGQGLGTFLIKKGEDVFFIHPGTNSPGAVCMLMGSPSAGQGLIIMSNGIQAELLHMQILFAVSNEYKWSLWKE